LVIVLLARKRKTLHPKWDCSLGLKLADAFSAMGNSEVPDIARAN
jgi:hypothetical protein